MYGLKELSRDFGMSVEDMLRESLMDGVSPAICTKCGYTTEMEPDQSQGWCEECESNSVVSALVLAGCI